VIFPRATFLILPLLGVVFATAPSEPKPADPGTLVVANQGDHTLLTIDLATEKTLGKTEVGVNGHEVAVAPDGKFAYVPIYGNSGVGKPGTDGDRIDIVDLRTHSLAGHIDLGKPVRPHCAKFGPDGLLYVSAELDNSIYAIDTATRKVVAKNPTDAEESHMFVITPNGKRAYTTNVGAGSVSVVDLYAHKLITKIDVAKTVQRTSISPDGNYIFTHYQDQPRIAVIDTSNNKIAKWIDVPGTIYSSAVTPDGAHLVAASPMGKVFVIDIAASKIISTFDVPKSAGELILSPDGQRAFLSCPQAASIQVLDLSSGKISASIPLTKGVDGLDWLRTM
jgi:YVTN family beta-propeller protein